MSQVRSLPLAEHPRQSPCNALGSFVRNLGFWAASKAPSVITGIIDGDFPHFRGNLFTGSLEHISEHTQATLQQMHALTHNDPNGICTSWVGINPAFLITLPEDIEQIAKLDPTHLGKSPPLDTFGAVFGFKNIFYTSMTKKDIKTWKYQRRLFERELLKPDALDNLWKKIPKIVEEHMKDLDNHEIELSHFFTHLAMDVIARTQLGSSPLGHRLDGLHKSIDDTMTTILDTNVAVRLGIYKKLHIAHTTKQLKEAKTSLQTTFKNLVVKPDYENICTTNNLFSSLVNADQEKEKKEIDSKLDLTTDAALSHGSFVFLAGHETTSKLMDFTVRILFRHPEVLRKLEDEFDLAEKRKGKPLVPEDIKDLIYLNSVIKEVLRLYPPISITARSVEKNCELNLSTGKKLTLKKGSIILISPKITHRDERVFQKANEFIPERWMMDNEPPKGAYIPFFLGPRKCPGELMAQIEAKVATFIMVRQYKLLLLAEKTHNILDTKIKGTLHAVHPAPVRCSRR